jgi:hypothetical protein
LTERFHDFLEYVSETEECFVIGRQLSVSTLEGELMAMAENSLSDRRPQVDEGRSWQGGLWEQACEQLIDINELLGGNQTELTKLESPPDLISIS